MPPPTTEITAPKSQAVRPDSRATDVVRGYDKNVIYRRYAAGMESGVSICTRGVAHDHAYVVQGPNKEHHQHGEQIPLRQPEILVAIPKPVTAQSMVRPRPLHGRGMGDQQGHGNCAHGFGRPQVTHPEIRLLSKYP